MASRWWRAVGARWRRRSARCRRRQLGLQWEWRAALRVSTDPAAGWETVAREAGCRRAAAAARPARCALRQALRSCACNCHGCNSAGASHLAAGGPHGQPASNSSPPVARSRAPLQPMRRLMMLGKRREDSGGVGAARRGRAVDSRRGPARRSTPADAACGQRPNLPRFSAQMTSCALNVRSSAPRAAAEAAACRRLPPLCLAAFGGKLSPLPRRLSLYPLAPSQ